MGRMAGGPQVLGIKGQGCLGDGDQAWEWTDLEQDAKGPGPRKGENQLPVRGCPQELGGSWRGGGLGMREGGLLGSQPPRSRLGRWEPEAGLGQAFLGEGQGWALGSGALQNREGASCRMPVAWRGKGLKNTPGKGGAPGRQGRGLPGGKRSERKRSAEGNRRVPGEGCPQGSG